MFRLMVGYCKRMMEMLGEVWHFQQKEACVFIEQFTQMNVHVDTMMSALMCIITKMDRV